MSEAPTGSAAPGITADLLEAASLLLETRSCLGAVRTLHGEVERAVNPTGASILPGEYSSTDVAREYHDQLRALLPQLSSSSARQRVPHGWSRRKLRLVRRTGVLVLVAVLLLRYLWSVSRQTAWARQHPEGNWVSRYYANPEFKGFPLVRYDTGVNVDFGAGAPASAMEKDGFSARWDTCLLVRRETSVQLSLKSDDTSRLLLDGVPQIEIGPQPGEKVAGLLLTPGMKHLSVELVEVSGMAMASLEGFEADGTEDYVFERPSIDALDVSCK